MTDEQLLNVVLKRAAIAGKERGYEKPKIVVVQQFHKKLFFAVKFQDPSCGAFPFQIRFDRSGISRVFLFPELPERLMQWKHDIIDAICNNASNPYPCIDFDMKTFPKEIVHVFFSGLISAFDTPGMSVSLFAAGDMFAPDETYEEVQIQADMEFMSL